MTWPNPLLRPLRLPAAALLLCSVALGCGRGAAQPEEEAHGAPVKAESFQRKALEQWTDLFGTSMALIGHAAQISAGVEGKVVAILPNFNGQRAVEGQQVAAGQVIVELDDRMAKANRTKLEANVKKLAQQKKQAELAIAQAKIVVANLEMLKGSASPPELEKARIALADAQAKDQAAVAEQQSAEAELQAADLQLSLYALKSPIAGKLGQIQAVLGQSLPPGTAVADVVSLDEIDVLCFVPSDVAARLQLEQPARITRLDNATLEKESSPTGKVVFIAVQGQAATGMFGVKVRFPNPDHKLRANAVVKLQVQTDHKKNALAIPAVALSADQEPPTVILVAQEKNKEGKELVKARVLQADVGIRDRAQNLVELRGLKDPETKQDVPLRDDMQFVIEGGIGLETGDLLAVQKEEKEKEK